MGGKITRPVSSTRNERNQRIPKATSIRSSDQWNAVNGVTYFPFTLHLSPAWSSLSATAWGIPTATSALFVRRLRIGKSPARGPTKGKFHEGLSPKSII